MSSFVILGSASGMPNPSRAGSGYLLQTGESLSLIDCGGGVASSFLRQGFDPHQLDRIFVSHAHADHVAELPVFIQMLHGVNFGRTLTVYVPEDFVQPLEAYLPTVFLLRNRLKLDLDIRGYSEGAVFDDGFRIEAIANTHGDKLKPSLTELQLPYSGQCYSFRITVDGTSILHSADIGSFADIELHLDEADYAIVETTHVSPQDIIDHARGSSVDLYVLTHLGNDAEVAELERLVRESGADNVRIAYDGMRLEIE
jgi:ribonuclease BN (tRNA processing enzyme)